MYRSFQFCSIAPIFQSYSFSQLVFFVLAGVHNTQDEYFNPEMCRPKLVYMRFYRVAGNYVHLNVNQMRLCALYSIAMPVHMHCIQISSLLLSFFGLVGSTRTLFSFSFCLLISEPKISIKQHFIQIKATGNCFGIQLSSTRRNFFAKR